jgi:thiol-disulfide isomerase/thioredoxin
MNKNAALIIVLVLIVSTISYLESTRIKIPTAGEPLEVKQGKYPVAPELTGITGYLNGAYEGMRIADFRGKVVLIDFWTYTCINCIRTFPFLIDWHNKYADKGLVIIGVHTPEFEFEKITENVEAAIMKYGIPYRVVQDNNYATWSAFKNRFWPRKYIIDKDGFIRYDHIGEGAYEETEKMIQRLLAETGKNVSKMNMTELPDLTPKEQLTPELYAGFNFAVPRGQDVGNPQKLRIGETQYFTLPNDIKRDVIYLQGLWLSNPDDLLAQDKDGASIVLAFTASQVNIVVGPRAEGTKMEVFINDKYVSKEQAGSDVQFKDNESFVLINGPRLYNIIDGSYGTYMLRLKVNSTTFNFAAFTFG